MTPVTDDIKAWREQQGYNGNSPAAGESWQPHDLGPVVDGTEITLEPTMLARDDGQNLLYPGKVIAFIGEPEACKGWMALHACAERIRAGEKVLYVDFESDAATIVSRLKAMHVDRIAELLLYVRPHDPQPKDPAWLHALLDEHRSPLAVLDGVTEAAALNGYSINSNDDMAAWRNGLAELIAARGGTVIVIDHVGRNKENRGRNAIGAQNKLGGVGAQFTFVRIKDFGIGLHGHVSVRVSKDRHGTLNPLKVAPNDRVADLHLHSDPATKDVTIELTAPGALSHDSDNDNFRPTYLMQRVSTYLEGLAPNDNPSGNSIKNNVEGKAAALHTAINVLEREGYVANVGTNQRGAYRHVKPYREAEDDDA